MKKYNKFRKFLLGCSYAGGSIGSVIRDYTDKEWIVKGIRLFLIPFGFVKWLIGGGTGVRDDKRKGLAVVAIIKNEAPYLKEWLDFYLTEGVDKVILYDNESTDNVFNVLNFYIKKGYVDYYRIKGAMRQLDAYNMAVDKYKNRYRYMAFLDLDEYLYCTGHRELFGEIEDFFREKEKAGGLAVNWLCYGSGGHEGKPKGAVVENYLYRAETQFEHNRHVKMVADPKRVLAFVTPHNPVCYRGYHNMTESGEVLHEPFSKKVSVEKFRVNHYFTKSKEEYMQKMDRGKADSRKKRTMEDFEIHDRNEVFDDDLLRYCQRKYRKGAAGS